MVLPGAFTWVTIDLTLGRASTSLTFCAVTVPYFPEQRCRSQQLPSSRTVRPFGRATGVVDPLQGSVFRHRQWRMGTGRRISDAILKLNAAGNKSAGPTHQPAAPDAADQDLGKHCPALGTGIRRPVIPALARLWRGRGPACSSQR